MKSLKKILLGIVLCSSPQTILAKEIQTGIASFYAHKHHGKKTASGERFNMYALTAAHKTIKLGTFVKVVNLKNYKQVIVKITDRGPYIKPRILDLSLAAARAIGITGIGMVSIQTLR